MYIFYFYLLFLTNICTLLASIQDHDTTLLIVTSVNMSLNFLAIVWVIAFRTRYTEYLGFVAFAGIVMYLTMFVRNINFIAEGNEPEQVEQVKIISTIFTGVSLIISGMFLYESTDIALRNHKVEPAGFREP